ncbi:unnamed protein product [Macrosiphum euphorbiae]|uniref:SCAN domain-containing protein 3 n=1 Tax=Macrosiphum euphorbiae TaxID=13131 RepID=A0AAV0WBW7_9HEMI|nr:unnamed protein product [Macrosiphum euphorbiae]
MLFARTLIADTKGESIFNTIKDYFKEKNIPLVNIKSVATDGAPAMVGRHRGFIAFLKKEVPGILAVHCVIHRQHLVAKNLSDRLHQSLRYVISAVNKIRSNSLNDRLFAQLCKDNDEEFNRFILHTEVRWLSKGACLNIFWNIFESILEFLVEKDVDVRSKLLQFKTDIAYMTDLFAKFNDINLQLQGDELNKISFDDTHIYCQHLQSLDKDFSQRFEDILSLEVPQWVINPFVNIESARLQYQEELIEISTNEMLKASFKNGENLTEFWLQSTISRIYPGLWTVVQKLLIAFPSSYLVERGFSAVTNLITKKRNRLDILKRGDLRLHLTNIEPNVKKLALDHQAQPSH